MLLVSASLGGGESHPEDCSGRGSCAGSPAGAAAPCLGHCLAGIAGGGRGKEKVGSQHLESL